MGLISDQKGPRAMARHARTDDAIEHRPARKEGAVSHRKSVRVSDTVMTNAVTRSGDGIVIAERFATAVRITYVGHKIAEAAGGNPARIVELIVTHLRGRGRLPHWTRDDVETTLDYLAAQGRIALPQPALAVS